MNRRVGIAILFVAAVAVASIVFYVPNLVQKSATSSTISSTTSSTTSMSALGTLSFLGNNTVMFSNDSKSGFEYIAFPYTNFSFNNFTFTYTKGDCQNTTGILILPCGSTLYAIFPSYGRVHVGTEAPAGSLHSQDGFQWTSISTGIVDGRLETVGLVLVIQDNGSRAVYVYTNIGN